MGLLKSILIGIVLFPVFLILLPFLLIYAIFMSPCICSGSIIKHSSSEYGPPTRHPPGKESGKHARVQGYFTNDDGMSIFWTATLPPKQKPVIGVFVLIIGMGEYNLRSSYDTLRDKLHEQGIVSVLRDGFWGKWVSFFFPTFFGDKIKCCLD